MADSAGDKDKPHHNGSGGKASGWPYGCHHQAEAHSVLDGQKYCIVWGAFLQSFVSSLSVVPLI